MILIVSRTFVEHRLITALSRPDPSWERTDGTGYVLYTNAMHAVMPGYAVQLTMHTGRKTRRYELEVYEGVPYSSHLVLVSGSSRLEQVVRAIDETVNLAPHDDAALYRLLTSIKHQK